MPIPIVFREQISAFIASDVRQFPAVRLAPATLTFSVSAHPFPFSVQSVELGGRGAAGGLPRDTGTSVAAVARTAGETAFQCFAYDALHTA